MKLRKITLQIFLRYGPKKKIFTNDPVLRRHTRLVLVGAGAQTSLSRHLPERSSRRFLLNWWQPGFLQRDSAAFALLVSGTAPFAVIINLQVARKLKPAGYFPSKLAARCEFLDAVGGAQRDRLDRE